MKIFLNFLVLSLSFAAFAMEEDEWPRTPAPKGAKAYIITPLNGDTVPTTFTVVFGLKGMGVAPAGIERENTGHHHLLIDTLVPPVNEPIPSDENHIHFGDGQTEVTLTLPPGKHTLQLLLADHYHLPHEPAIFSKKITIIVEE